MNQRSMIGENAALILCVPNDWAANRTTRMAMLMPTTVPTADRNAGGQGEVKEPAGRPGHPGRQIGHAHRQAGEWAGLRFLADTARQTCWVRLAALKGKIAEVVDGSSSTHRCSC